MAMLPQNRLAARRSSSLYVAVQTPRFDHCGRLVGHQDPEDTMSAPQFHETYIGREFYQSTMPKLVKQLERLNEVLERLVVQREAGSGEAKGAGPLA